MVDQISQNLWRKIKYKFYKNVRTLKLKIHNKQIDKVDIIKLIFCILLIIIFKWMIYLNVFSIKNIHQKCEWHEHIALLFKILIEMQLVIYN